MRAAVLSLIELILVAPRHVHALILPVELLTTKVIICSLDRIELPRTHPRRSVGACSTLAHSTQQHAPLKAAASSVDPGTAACFRWRYCCSILICSRPGGRASWLPGPRAWLPPPAQQSGPRQKCTRTGARDDAARRRTAGGPADSSKARALLSKFTVPRLPRLFSRLMRTPRAEKPKSKSRLGRVI